MKVMCWLILAALIAVINGLPQTVNYEGHQVISVIPKTNEDLEFLSKLQSHEVDFWSEPVSLKRPVMMRLSPDVQQTVRSQLEERNMDIEITFENVQKIIDNEKKSQMQRFMETTFDLSRYHDYPQIMNFMKQLTEDYPDLAEMESIGMSYQNRSINILRIGGKEQMNKPLVVLQFGLHAREWISVATANYIMNRLVTEYGIEDEITQLVDKFEFMIIPVANPDGYQYTHEVDRYWRKTLSEHSSSNCIGVDANRNFDVEHCSDYPISDGSSNKCGNTYCGPKPFSESETRALRDLMLNNKERIEAYFDIHSFSQLWLTPFAYKQEKPYNYDELVCLL